MCRPFPLLAAAFAAAILFASCRTAPEAPPAAPERAPVAATDATTESWSAAMKQIRRRYDAIEAALARPPFGDLRAVAAAAQDAAERLRLGYGMHEDRAVPGFARMARDAESWLLEVALEARQAHGHIAAERFFAGRQRHCGDCHDAHERVHG